MSKWKSIALLIAMSVPAQAFGQQAQQAQHTQDPTSQNSPTSIGPDPFKAHDSTTSTQERAAEGAKSKANEAGTGSRPAGATYLCPDGKGGTQTSTVKGEGCTLKSPKGN